MNSTYSIADTELMTSVSLTSSSFNNSPLKHESVMLRPMNSPDYLAKEDFIHQIQNDVPLNLQAVGSRYRHSRVQNSHKLSLEENAFNLRTFPNEIQDLSFSEELPPFNRPIHNAPTVNQYCYKPVGSSVDMYQSDFSDEFSNDNFCASLPPTSSMFPQNDAASTYILPETASDELLLNGIELNDSEKLILSNEDLAMLTQGKQGSCLELILNNGEVLYAVVDSENDYNPSLPRLPQVPKETIPSMRSYSIEADINDSLVNHVSGSSFESGLANSSSFESRTSPVPTFHQSSPHYSTVISSSLGKSIASSTVAGENFNLCCDFSTEDNDNFQSVLDPYQPVVSEKPSSLYEGSLMRNDHPSSIEPKKLATSQPTTRIERVPSKMDYFPSAVNSIVVPETGKKYPKKYSFYSNISSFMNQESFDKRSEEKSVKIDKSLDISHGTSLNSTPSTAGTETIAKSCSSENVAGVGVEILNQTRLIESVKYSETDQQVAIPSSHRENNRISEIIMLDDSAYNVKRTQSVRNNQISPLDLHSYRKSVDYQDELNENFLNSHEETAVNCISDRAIKSRARASLPDSYLSINRIKLSSNNKRIAYGVFARQTIPNRTQFGPVEGVLVKEEMGEEVTHGSEHATLQLTVELEKGKFYKLDISNEDTCNWMKFVRAAITRQEQNLIVSQRGNALYFTTIDVIHPMQELLVWYGDEYARIRNYRLLADDTCTEITDAVAPATERHKRSTPITTSSAAEHAKADNAGESLSYVEKTNLESVTECPPSQPNNFVDVTKRDINTGAKKSKSSACSTSTYAKKNDKSKKCLWLCTYCDLTFSNASVMNFHVLVHATNNVEGVNSVESKKQNRHSTDGEETFECPQCCQKFNKMKELITHVSKHGIKVQRWTDNNVANSAVDPVEDSESEKNENFDTRNHPCLSCHKSFKTALALEIHARFHSASVTLECPMCEMTFKKLTDMREHVHTHAVNGIFTCPHCPKTYDRYRYMRKHIRSCHAKTTFCCKLCKKTCKSQYKLRSHMLRHSDEKEFLCSICGKLFKRMDKLSEHVKNTHSEEREKNVTEIIGRGMKLKRSMKKKLPNKVLRLIAENVNDYFYKCYICNIGFKRRGMLVNHLNLFHPGVSLDTIPELNVPIQKAYCNFYCLYCDKVYKSNSKRKGHILKSHPGAKIPGNLERGSVLNDPYAKHVGNVISNPFNCDFCHRQYASRAKLLNHYRKNHADSLPADLKSPRNWNAKRKRRKEAKSVQSVSDNQMGSANECDVRLASENLPSQTLEFKTENCNYSATTNTDLLPAIVPPVRSITSKMVGDEAGSDVNQQMMSLTHLLNDDIRNNATTEQYVKILQSSNGLTLAQTDENSTAILQQILTSYSFSNS